MNVEKIYAKAAKAFESKKFVAALKILKDLQKHAPAYKKSYYLESLIWNERKNYVKSYQAMKKVLPFSDISSPAGKEFASKVCFYLAYACDNLGLNEEYYKYLCLGKDLAVDEKLYYDLMEALIFITNAFENFSAADFQAIYDEYKRKLSDIVPFPRRFYDHEKIRVGFLSADFKRHPVVKWSWHLLTGFDRSSFEIHYYASVNDPDKLTEQLSNIADFWHDIKNLTDEEAAKLIRDNEIDILVELGGHTANTRIRVAAYHPASVQICGIGYMNSSGLDFPEYFLSDVYLTEKVATVSNYFAEKVIRLPHSHICYEPMTKFDLAPAPPCLKKGYITFGSFNNYRKITDSILHTWKKILDAVPNSRLILKLKLFNTDDGKNFVGKRLKNFGFDLSRVEMRPRTFNWLAEYADIDIALDTFPYTGGVTTCEALYMGVPVVSLYGDRPGTRFGYSILKNIGLDELAVESYDDYVNRAIALANDWELLDILRKNLRTMMQKSPLMDWKNYILTMEKTFIIILDTERKNFEQNN